VELEQNLGGCDTHWLAHRRRRAYLDLFANGEEALTRHGHH
jgi:hypothetical protein